MEKWYPAVAEYITDHREEILEDLKALARIPSISVAGKDGLPFGKEVDEMLSHAAELFEKNGIPARVEHDRGYALAVKEGVGDGIGVFGHGDVVPVNEDWIKTSPFEPKEEDGILYGRGVNDNKGGVIAPLYAIRALQAAGVELKSRISVYIGGSEETGMQDIEGFVKYERMPEVSLVPDGGFPASLGEKGIIRVDCRSRKPLQDVVKLDGGKAYNVILDKVEVALKNGESFVAEGLTSHAAYPEGSVNAANKAAQQLLEMPICPEDKEILTALRDVTAGYYGEALNIQSSGVFGNLTCATGITRVEEDGRLLFTLDIRYGNEVDSAKAVKNLTDKLDSYGYDAHVTELDEGFLLDAGGKAMEIIVSSCREVCDKPDAEPYLMFGGTYSRKLKNAYTMSHSAPWDNKSLDLPAGHGGAHQSDEAMNIDAWLQGICTMALIIGRLDAWLMEEK